PMASSSPRWRAPAAATGFGASSCASRGTSPRCWHSSGRHVGATMNILGVFRDKQAGFARGSRGLLSPEERDELLDRIATAIAGRGLATPASFLLELNRPLSFAAGQATHVLTPLLAPLVGLANMEQLACLLEDRPNIDRLLERL